MIYKYIPLGKFKRMHIHPKNRAICARRTAGDGGSPRGKGKRIKTGIDVMLGQQMICAVGKNE
jgi:hypothetical protein